MVYLFYSYEMTEWSDAICTYLKLEQREHNQQSLGVQPTSAMPVPSSPILLHHSTPPQIPITTIDSVSYANGQDGNDSMLSHDIDIVPE